MRSCIHLLVGVSFLIMSIGGCVSPSDIQNLQAQINELKESQLRSHSEIQLKIKHLKEEFNTSLTNSTFSVRSTQADIASEIDNLRLQIARLRGEEETLKLRLADSSNATEQLSSRINSLTASVERLKKELDSLKGLLGVGERNVKREEKKVGPSSVGIKNVSSPSPPQKLEISPDKLYNRAISNFKNKNYHIAVHLFSLFLKKFPRHLLVPNAYFWRGECYYQMKEYPQAILNYQKVIDKFPSSNKYKGALLKEGMAFYLINKARAGKILLNELIDKFPSSREAKVARAFLRTHK